MKPKNEALQKLYDTIVNSTIAISPYADSQMEKTFEECDRELAKLQNRNDILEKSNGILLDANLDLCSKNRDLKNQLDKANSDKTTLQKNLDYYMDIYKKVQDDYDDLHKKYSECQGTVDKQAEQIKSLKARLNNISNACGRTQDDIYGHGYEQGQTDLWGALQTVNDVKPWDISSFYPDVSSMNDIISWDMEDFLDAYKKWQEEKEKERLEHMRDYLNRFCKGRLCSKCPLHTDNFKCEGVIGFNNIPDEDLPRYYEKAHDCGRYTLKDAKLFATTVEGVNRAITKACEGFCEAVKDADIKITENLRNGYTLKATVDVDKDLVEKICGVKPEEKKSKPGELVITTRGVTTANYSEATMNAIKEAVRRFEKSLPALDSWESTITGSIKVDDILGNTDNTEHKLEYGDAVRVPWRDYDYMYIGPDEKEETLVHLFDPENHTIVTTHILNVRYNGGRILVSEEDDIRKIWKYMK